MACLNFLGGWGCSGWLWTHDLSKIMTTALIGSLLLFPFSDVQWGHLVCYTPTSQTSISSNLFFPFSSLLQNPLVPVSWLVLCGLSTVPFLSLLWRVTPVPLAPAPLPGPYRNALGLVIAFVGAIELYGWLKLPNLTARWPLNGAQRGAALQTTAAAKFLQWRPTITPTQAPIYRQAGGTGRGGGLGMCWWRASVLGSAQKWKSLHLTPNKTDTFFLRYIATLDWLFG